MKHALASLVILAANFGTIGTADAHDKPITPQNDAPAVRRVALVIGNSHYAAGRLSHSEEDARKMARKLKEIGFDVTLALDAERFTLSRTIRAFASKLSSKNAVGFFYYSGHAVKYQGRNFLVPIGYAIDKPEDYEFEGYDVGRLLAALRDSGNQANVVVLDACRIFPLSDKGFGEWGLTSIDVPENTFIAFAAAPGKVVADDGTYCECLVKNLKIPGLRIEDIFKRARRETVERSRGTQVPWDSGFSVSGFVLIPKSVPPPRAQDGPGAATLASWLEKGGAFRDGMNGQNVSGIPAVR
jgi:uncharacterized caspase-like protein